MSLMSSIRRSPRVCSGSRGICRSPLIDGVGASAIPTLIKAPMMDRIAAQTLAYAALGANLARSRKPWTSVLGALAGVGCGLVGCILPLLAAITSWWPIWPTVAVIAILVALAEWLFTRRKP